MGIARERGDVAHAIITSAAREHIVEHERSEGSIAAGAAAADHHPIGVDATALSEKLRAIDTIVDVDHAPVALQSVPVGAAKTTATSVIHVKHRNAAARPILDAE